LTAQCFPHASSNITHSQVIWGSTFRPSKAKPRLEGGEPGVCAQVGETLAH
jgi:hypothetical protein